MSWLWYGAGAAAMLWQLPRVRQSGERRGTLVWLVVWLLALTLFTLYEYGGQELAQWRLM